MFRVAMLYLKRLVFNRNDATCKATVSVTPRQRRAVSGSSSRGSPGVGRKRQRLECCRFKYIQRNHIYKLNAR